MSEVLIFFNEEVTTLFQLRVARWLHLMETRSFYMQTTTAEGFLGGCAVYSPSMAQNVTF